MTTKHMDAAKVAKKTANALQRLDALEQTMGGIVQGVNNALNQLQQQLAGFSETLGALVQSIGQDEVERLMVENRAERGRQLVESEKAGLAAMLAAGDVVAGEKVTEKSLLVGRELDKDGVVAPPGRAQTAFSRIEPGFQAGLLGQAVGFALDLPTGGKFVVDEIYEVVDRPAAPPAAAPETTPAPVES